MTQSPTSELAAALAKAQSAFKPLRRTSTNPYYNSRYAELSECIAACSEALQSNGLAVSQSPSYDPQAKVVTVTTLLMHTSGQWLQGELSLPAEGLGKDKQPKLDAHTIGSAITYARRYAYQAILGIAAEDDDDGNRAAHVADDPEVFQSRPAAVQPKGRAISAAQAKRFWAIAHQAGADDAAVDAVLAQFGVAAVGELSLADYDAAVDAVDPSFRFHSRPS